MRVLQVIGGLGVGGAEAWLLSLMRYWREHGGPEVEFLLTNGREEVLDAEARGLGARLHYLTFSRREPLRFLGGYRRLLASGGFSAVHDHCDLATGLHLMAGAGRLPRIRIAHLHNHPAAFQEHYLTSPTRRGLARVGRRLILRGATHVLATSRGVLEGFGFGDLTGAGPEARVLHCGIHAPDYRRNTAEDRARLLHEFGWAADSRVALCVGRLDRSLTYPHPSNQKNTAFSLDVARAAIRKERRLRLLVVGDGPSREAFQQQVAAWHLSQHIHLAGIRRDLPALMGGADVLLFPSVSEALGMAVVEAQAAGLAVLASEEVSREAVIVPDRFKALSLSSTPEHWASCLLELASAPRPSPGECFRALEASPFSVRASASALEAIYRGA